MPSMMNYHLLNFLTCILLEPTIPFFHHTGFHGGYDCLLMRKHGP